MFASLCELQELVKDWEAWHAAAHGVTIFHIATFLDNFFYFSIFFTSLEESKEALLDNF